MADPRGTGPGGSPEKDGFSEEGAGGCPPAAIRAGGTGFPAVGPGILFILAGFTGLPESGVQAPPFPISQGYGPSGLFPLQAGLTK